MAICILTCVHIHNITTGTVYSNSNLDFAHYDYTVTFYTTDYDWQDTGSYRNGLATEKVAGSNPGLDNGHVVCPVTNDWFAGGSTMCD
jgi:hypothetical protein